MCPPNYLVSRLLDHKCDIAIMLDRFYNPDERLSSAVLLDTDYLLLASRDALPEGSTDYSELFKAPLLYDALEMESPNRCSQRCQKEIALLGLTPEETIWVNNTDTAFSRVQTVEGGVVITSSADRLLEGRGLVGYPTGKICHVLVVWRSNETDPLVKSYIQYLQDIFGVENKKFTPATEPVEF